jgi:aminoglycoside phosphotransferase (APT) family kinase protein
LTGGRLDRAQAVRVLAAALPGARLLGTRRLKGGLSTTGHVLRVAHVGRNRLLVLRQYTHPQAAPGRPADEWAALRLVAGHHLPAPEPLWHDGGEVLGVPAILLTHLPGRLPHDRAIGDGQLDEVAAFTAAVHDIDTDGSGLVRDEAWLRRERPAEAPSHWLRFKHGQEGWDIVRAWIPTLAGAPAVLCHGDLHLGNTLWSRGRLTGVIDWEVASLESPGFDVAYTQLDLALMEGPELADRYVAAYEAVAGPVADLARWQIVAAARAFADYREWAGFYRLAGRPDLTDALVRRRLQAFLSRAVASA